MTHSSYSSSKAAKEEEIAAPLVPEEDDWKLPLDFHLFAQHERHSVYVSSTESFEIECVEALTPLDMMSLSSGVHDATGFCVWTGAFLFIAAIDELRRYFSGKRVIELGCGTGIAGLGLLRSRSAPSYLCLTDADPNALRLCEKNCGLNVRGDSSGAACSIETLTWGTPLPLSIKAGSFDTVFAADILYDIGMLRAVLKTTKGCLRNGGCFVLSHVPRACFNSDNPPVENLEEYIIQQAKQYGLQLQSILRPRDISREEEIPVDALNSMTLQEMDDIGAAILVFENASQH